LSDLLSHRLALLAEHSNLPLLSQCLHGIERECLRVDGQGKLALTPHPRALGSALTHPKITTDYSEALLEFITGTETDPERTLAELDAIHRYTYSKLGDEFLWSPSMPGHLPDESQIPIAEYGSSNIGRLKYVYRQGLALRYGKTMQCIAGIHYNFSLPEALWSVLQADEGDDRPQQDYQSWRYIALIRNFRRYSWLLMYLFGASPALDASFMRGRSHQLEQLDEDTLYLPWATSLRMSDLGYQSNAQAGLTPCYDDLPSYTSSLHQAVSTPYPEYAALGIKDANGNWQQLNTNVLQIENEYYSNIRPKRVTASGERPLHALRARGIQYIEVRCLDINPFLPLGIDVTEARFLDAFLLFCAWRQQRQLPQGGQGRPQTRARTAALWRTRDAAGLGQRIARRDRQSSGPSGSEPRRRASLPGAGGSAGEDRRQQPDPFGAGPARATPSWRQLRPVRPAPDPKPCCLFPRSASAGGRDPLLRRGRT
jgi:glutamate--cysteine ligase